MIRRRLIAGCLLALALRVGAVDNTLRDFDPGPTGTAGPASESLYVAPERDAEPAEPDSAVGARVGAAIAALPVPGPGVPSLLRADTDTKRDALDVERRWPAAARASDGVVRDRIVVAYYGHPNSRRMGALGETDLPVMAELLKARAAEYDALAGAIGVAPAFHIIFATVHPDATVGVIREAQLLEYIEFAAANNIIVFLDHQIGAGTVRGAIERMLPYLRYPHVHLAFDPEWATTRPGLEIGGVDASEINMAQQMMQDYLIEHRLPGTRMLVVHQFNWRMILNREQVRADFPRVDLIHHADGFGNPAQKVDSWRFNVLAGNIPLKGFKLFYPKSWRAGGYDSPLMTPADVMRLDPVPVYIQYQ